MRLELFFKSVAEIGSLAQCYDRWNSNSENVLKIVSFNIPNKAKGDSLMQSIKYLKQQCPSSDVCVHYSLKFNSAKSEEYTVENFVTFCEQADALRCDSVLLVSGGGPKKKVNSLTCLQSLKVRGFVPKLKIGVAFNPYFPDEESRQIEEDRLRLKFATGLVSHVWLQFGSDVDRLKKAMKFLDTLKLRESGVHIVGSMFVPSKVFLARMKFRPWNGVFLSDSFLGDVDTATSIVRNIADVYREYNVEILVETAMRADKDLMALSDLIQPVEVVHESSGADASCVHIDKCLIDDCDYNKLRGIKTNAQPIATSDSIESLRKRRKL